MKKQSAGMMLFKSQGGKNKVMLVHPGGPFWAKKDVGAWSIPKGEFADGEQPLEAAKREFAEELGKPAPRGNFIELGSAKQSGGKTVYAWALESDFDASTVASNMFSIEWPPKSGRMQEFPEVDRAGWFSLDEGAKKIVKGQLPLLKALASRLGEPMADLSEDDKTKPAVRQMQLL
jgi:predicted NUDIX family NTP pyrophosphohydrolase